MARVAGTASALNGMPTLGVSSVPAAIFDRMIHDTVTPMAAGLLLHSVLTLVVFWWVRGVSPAIVEPPVATVTA